MSSSPYGRNMPQSKISERERTHPGTIRAVTGWMDTCVNCHRPFRRLGTREFCGCCSPVIAQTDSAGYRVSVPAPSR